MLRSTERRSTGDRGAFLIIFALALTVILTFVAFAVDLGQARSSQRSNRSTADLAALSAGYWLAGGKFTGVQPVADARQACVAAVQSVQTNEPSFQPAEDPASHCNTLAACDSASPPATQPAPIAFNDEKHMVLYIQYPVLDGSAGGLNDPRFPGAGLEDGDDPCERMRITLERTDRVSFAGVIGVSSLQTRGSVVVKGEINDPDETAIPAFLILERTDCASITTSVGSGPGIEVFTTTNSKGELQPGFIHTDSNATGTNCKKDGTRDSYAVYGGNAKDPESIILYPAGKQLGIVETRAPDAQGMGGYVRGNHRTGGLVSRQPVDDVYGKALAGIHSPANLAVAGITFGTREAAKAANFDVFNCDGALLEDGSSDDSRAYVLCGTLENSLTLPNYEVVRFSGSISLKKGAVVSLPSAVDLAVKGSVAIAIGTILDIPAAENVAIGDGVSVAGTFSVNRFVPADPAPVTEPQCPARIDPEGKDADKTNNNLTIGKTARVVVFSSAGPALNVSGNLTLCETSLYLAGARTSDYSRQTDDDTGDDCTDKLPCPVVTAEPSAFYEFGSKATINLIGPNSTKSSPPLNGWPWSTTQPGGVEDLAFWSESGSTFTSKAGANITISGVFAAPNGFLFFQSGPVSTKPVDAQYVARMLEMKEGLLKMQPTASNTVPVPVPGSFSLIR